MSTEGVNQSRRRFLVASTSVVGAMGVAAAAYPFVAYWQPSAKAQAAGAPVEVDISKLEPGQRMTVEWRGKPVWIVRRTKEILEALPTLNTTLRDPESAESLQPAYAKNPNRAIKDEYLVVVGICTHLGCSPNYVPLGEGGAALGSSWKGGFFCPCHGSRFDLAGRVFQGVPAPTNLTIPPYNYLSDTRILVGADKVEGAA
ncbi:ubiquinol-cytochrome c reductase iron-sulfur subunit [Beggiatoa leptomitoformis]|uniref:Ubiquinol-cytochrome c reductase iron-sulfur subunit n=1 Tax=Beggiatoa leptomitoformis TaxID=288004 RepID=A0A2N9YGY1_9GAMM|nr:ubiquinol-cytochrome c reductase iron-sulfur subunit [Beggiatoa leptomitoformis]ALG67965.1 ubiquinol-cytochrome c reductase iron-sulfur subunit [Beggiatoa leptomitoformis]AUI69757.1 ubiquinol-cytochrome c reductase iron-sulfur subunit [Beggiatoa leptomitoformis]